MPKVTDDLHIPIPDAIAERYGIRPGDEVQLVPLGSTLRVVPAPSIQVAPLDEAAAARARRLEEWLRRWGGVGAGAGLFPETRAVPGTPQYDRGWAREDLYEPPRGWRP